MIKTIFITGASSGLGKKTALLFAQKGWNVIATMRNPAAETDLDKEKNISLLALDVTNLEQINNSIANLLKTTSVDIVLNNAGYALAGPFEGATDEQIQQEINTNLLGVLRVTKAFIGHFREKVSGTFINITSIGGLVAFPLNSVYHATKWGIEGWSESLSYELKPFGITVKTISPGGIKTDFFLRSLVMTNHDAYKTMVDKLMAAFTDPAKSKRNRLSTPEEIATVVFKAATDGKKQLRYLAGKDAIMMFKIRRWLGYKFFMRLINRVLLK
jgi:NAD(P)-dependent dehydrogenase (short-subunit alcohol dehydrogenase family)